MKLIPDGTSFPVPFDSSWNVVDSTKLNQLISCPRSFFYCYVLGWRPDYPSNHLVFGSAVHLALEHLLLNGYEQEVVLEAFDAFQGDYRQTFPPHMDDMFHPKTPQNFFAVLAKYAREYRRDLETYEVLYTEISGTVSVDADVDLAFRMDSILRNRKTGRVSSLEHKTGSSTYFWAEQWPLSIQVGTYTHVLNCLFPRDKIDGVVMNALFFFKVKKAWDKVLTAQPLGSLKPPYEFMRVPVKRDNKQMLVWQWTVLYYVNQLRFYFEELANAKESDSIMATFPMRPDSCFKYGRICDYYDYCCAWPNPLQRCQQPPLGFTVNFWNPLEQEAKHEFKL